MEILDRDIETKKISGQINNATYTEVLVLCGKVGIGKTMTAEKLKHNNDIMRPFWFLKEPLPETPREGEYIWNFYQKVYVNYNKKIPWLNRKAHKMTYGYFLNKKYGYRRQSIKQLIDNMPAGLNSGLMIIKVIAAIIEYAIFPFFNAIRSYQKPIFSRDNISQYCDYIIYILGQLDIVVALDNIQNIDDLSRKYLLQCISRLNDANVFFILEYSFSNDNKLELSDLRAALEKFNIRYSFETINKLKPDDAYATVKDLKPSNVEEEEFKKAMINYYIFNSKGDLKDLIAYAISFQTSGDEGNRLSTLLKLLESESAISIFAIIMINNRKILKSVLWDIYEKSGFKYLLNMQEGLLSLKSNKLIEEDDHYYYIANKSITIQWIQLENEENYFTKYILNVLNELQRYYEEIDNKSKYTLVSESECFFILVKIYIRLNPHKLYNLIGKLGKIAGTFVSPEQGFGYYKIILKELEHKRKDFISAYYQAFRFCCGLELYDDAYEVLLSIKSDIRDKDEYNINYALVLYYREKYEESLLFIERHMPKENTRIKLYYQLLKLLIFRMTNQNEKCIAVADDINKNKADYYQYKEYAYYLCLSDLYKSKTKAIEDISNGIKLLDSYKLYDEAYKFRLSLSYLYGTLYQTTKALNILNECEKFINNQLLYKVIFLNNRSAFNLLIGNFSNQISDDLNIAEDYARDSFSKLVILNNHLIWCFETNNSEIGNFICREIIGLADRIHEKQLISLLYYNIYLFYYKDHQEKLANDFYQKSYELIEYSCNLRWRFSCQGPLTLEQLKFLEKPWNIFFLSRWEITYLKY